MYSPYSVQKRICRHAAFFLRRACAASPLRPLREESVAHTIPQPVKTLLRNGPNRAAKQTVSHGEMGRFAPWNGPFRKPLYIVASHEGCRTAVRRWSDGRAEVPRRPHGTFGMAVPRGSQCSDFPLNYVNFIKFIKYISIVECNSLLNWLKTLNFAPTLI